MSETPLSNLEQEITKSQDIIPDKVKEFFGDKLSEMQKYISAEVLGVPVKYNHSVSQSEIYPEEIIEQAKKISDFLPVILHSQQVEFDYNKVKSVIDLTLYYGDVYPYMSLSVTGKLYFFKSFMDYFSNSENISDPLMKKDALAILEKIKTAKEAEKAGVEQSESVELNKEEANKKPITPSAEAVAGEHEQDMQMDQIDATPPLPTEKKLSPPSKEPAETMSAKDAKPEKSAETAKETKYKVGDQVNFLINDNILENAEIEEVFTVGGNIRYKFADQIILEIHLIKAEEDYKEELKTLKKEALDLYNQLFHKYYQLYNQLNELTNQSLDAFNRTIKEIIGVDQFNAFLAINKETINNAQKCDALQKNIDVLQDAIKKLDEKITEEQIAKQLKEATANASVTKVDQTIETAEKQPPKKKKSIFAKLSNIFRKKSKIIETEEQPAANREIAEKTAKTSDLESDLEVDKAAKIAKAQPQPKYQEGQTEQAVIFGEKIKITIESAVEKDGGFVYGIRYKNKIGAKSMEPGIAEADLKQMIALAKIKKREKKAEETEDTGKPSDQEGQVDESESLLIDEQRETAQKMESIIPQIQTEQDQDVQDNIPKSTFKIIDKIRTRALKGFVAVGACVIIGLAAQQLKLSGYLSESDIHYPNNIVLTPDTDAEKENAQKIVLNESESRETEKPIIAQEKVIQPTTSPTEITPASTVEVEIISMAADDPQALETISSTDPAVWSLIKNQLAKRVTGWDELTPEEQTYVIDHFENKARAHPQNTLGLKNIDKVRAGQEFNFSPLFPYNREIKTTVQEAQSLPPAAKANIRRNNEILERYYSQPHPSPELKQKAQEILTGLKQAIRSEQPAGRQLTAEKSTEAEKSKQAPVLSEKELPDQITVKKLDAMSLRANTDIEPYKIFARDRDLLEKRDNQFFEPKEIKAIAQLNLDESKTITPTAANVLEKLQAYKETGEGLLKWRSRLLAGSKDVPQQIVNIIGDQTRQSEFFNNLDNDVNNLKTKLQATGKKFIVSNKAKAEALAQLFREIREYKQGEKESEQVANQQQPESAVSVEKSTEAKPEQVIEKPEKTPEKEHHYIESDNTFWYVTGTGESRDLQFAIDKAKHKAQVILSQYLSNISENKKFNYTLQDCREITRNVQKRENKFIATVRMQAPKDKNPKQNSQ